MLMLQMQIKWVEISRNQKIVVILIFQFWAMNLYKLLNIINNYDDDVYYYYTAKTFD